MNLTDLLTVLKPSVLNKDDRAAALPYLSMVPGPVGIGADVAQNVDAYGPGKGMMASVANLATPAIARGMLGKAAGNTLGGMARGIFAGERAKTADLDKLEKAKRLERAVLDANGRQLSLPNVTPADRIDPRRLGEVTNILDRTGWFRGADGRWRFEISDAKSSPIPKTYGDMFRLRPPKDPRMDEANRQAGTSRPYPFFPMEEIYRHDDLYEAYPELAKMRFAFNNDNMTHYARDTPAQAPYFGDPYVTLDRKWWLHGKADDVREPMVHELQHAVQDIEGFARGGNNKSIEAAFNRAIAANDERQYQLLLAHSPHDYYRKLAGEVEARNVQDRRSFSRDKRKLVSPFMSEEFPAHEQFLEFYPSR